MTRPTTRPARQEVQLVSHGWSKRCEVCERRTHAKWHEIAKGDVNPVALIQFVERNGNTPESRAIIDWVLTVTGIGEATMREMLRLEQSNDG